MMRNPMVQQMMEQMAENPESLMNMMGNSPEMQQLLRDNPEMASAMQDPENIRRSMQAATDPDYMRAMMQQRDRQMSNISSSSRGYNALQRHHDEISGPLQDAQAAAARRAAGIGGASPAA